MASGWCPAVTPCAIPRAPPTVSPIAIASLLSSAWVSHGRCTIAEVVEIGKVEYQQVIERLVRHFMDDLGAPTLEAARTVAEDEAAYTAELCESFSPEVWITVKRTPGDDGIKEHYSVFKRLMIGGHKL
jgi:hypothetical protein